MRLKVIIVTAVFLSYLLSCNDTSDKSFARSSDSLQLQSKQTSADKLSLEDDIQNDTSFKDNDGTSKDTTSEMAYIPTTAKEFEKPSHIDKSKDKDFTKKHGLAIDYTPLRYSIREHLRTQKMGEKISQKQLLKETFLCDCINLGFPKDSLFRKDGSMALYGDLLSLGYENFLKFNLIAENFMEKLQRESLQQNNKEISRRDIFISCLEYYQSKELDDTLRTIRFHDTPPENIVVNRAKNQRLDTFKIDQQQLLKDYFLCSCINYTFPKDTLFGKDSTLILYRQALAYNPEDIEKIKYTARDFIEEIRNIPGQGYEGAERCYLALSLDYYHSKRLDTIIKSMHLTKTGDSKNR